MKHINWQYCNDLNDINDAISSEDRNWEGLTNADDIISITFDNNQGRYLVVWRVD